MVRRTEPEKREDPLVEEVFWTMGDRIHFSRRKARLSQNSLGDLTRIGASSLSDYERDRARPSAQAIAALSWVLNVSADFLLGLVSEPRPLREGTVPFDIYALPEEKAPRVKLNGKNPRLSRLAPVVALKDIRRKTVGRRSVAHDGNPKSRSEVSNGSDPSPMGSRAR